MAGLDWADDEWELVNDDGFVYKRKKRPRLDPPTTSSSSSHPPLPDPTAEENNRRERKRTALVKLKQKYQREIRQWEHLSNTLKAMQEKASIQQQTHPELPTPSSDLAASTSAPPGNSSRQLIDELLSQAEIQEAIICDISNLCDVAEALCSAQEERLKQSFIDLPIWAKSPRELITSLCEECNSGMEEAYQDLRRKARTMAEASDDIKLRAGSVIEISRLLGYVLQIKVMGEVMSTVESKLLCRACIYLYLGDDPFDKEAKDKFGCLGHTCCLPFK